MSKRKRKRIVVWKQSYWYDVQVIHVLAGMLIIYAGLTYGFRPLPLLAGFIGGVAIKEFIIDVSSFEGDSWSGSAQDFIGYLCGAVCGLAAFGHFWFGAGMGSATIAVLFLWDWRHPSSR